MPDGELTFSAERELMETNGNSKPWLIRRIARRLLERAYGDLSERARRRAEELADDADLRTTSPRERNGVTVG